MSVVRKETTNRRPCLTPLACLFLGLASTAFGQTTTWNGSVSTNWSTAGNWSAGVPTSVLDVVIPSGTPNQPSTAGAGAASCRNLTINAGATLTLAVLQNLAASGNTLVNGTLAGGGTLVMTGSGSHTLGAGTYPNLTIDKTGGTATVSGSPNVSTVLTLLNGTLAIPNGTTLRLLPGGAASFTGGTLGGGSGSGNLDLDGNVAFVGTLAAAPFPNITCAGNWQADPSFVPPAGTVVFDTVGGASQTISGAGPTFSGLTTGINSIVTFNAATSVAGSTLFQGTATTNAVLTTGGALTLNLGGTFNSGAFTHVVGGNVTVNGTLNGASAFLLNGTSGATISGNAPFKSLVVAKSPTATTATVSGSVTLNGNLTVNSGTFALGGVTTVNGNCLFAGGVVSGGSLLDANGTVTFSGGAATGGLNANVSGDWTSNALFAPTSGLVTFDGGGTKTVFGTNVLFFGLTVAAGTTLVTSVPVEIDSALTVGGVLTTQAPINCDGTATVQSASQWNAGAHTHTFGTSLTIASATLNAVGGTFLFDGFSAGSVSSTPVLPNVVIAKLGGAAFSSSGVTVGGSFTLASGNLTTASTVVNGPVTMTGGIYSGGVLDVNGPITFGGTLCVNAGAINVTGQWSADTFFNPTSGSVVFDGTVGQTVVGSAANFPTLTIAASANVATALPMSVKGVLTVNGVLTTTSTVDVDGATTLAASGTMNLGVAMHSFGGSTTFTGILNATGTFVYDGFVAANVTAAVTNTLPHVVVARSGGAQLILTTDGLRMTTLTLNSGEVVVSGTTVLVFGDAAFNGGALSGPASSNLPPDFSFTTIDVAGDVEFNGAACINAPNINCAGDWTAHPSFDPIQGRVTFDGVGNHALIGANAKFFSLKVNPNYSLTVPTNLDLANNLTVAGVFATTGVMTIGGDVSVVAGVLSPGAATHFIGGDFTSTGVVQPTGALVFNGATNASLNIPTTAPSITIAKTTSGVMTLTGDTNVAGGFVVSSGTFSASSFVLTVTGDASFSGGSINAALGGVLDIAGDVAFTGTLCTGTISMECGGDWSANGNFFPSGGTVTFDGVTPQVLSGGPLRFPAVDVDILASVSTGLGVVMSGGLSVGTAGVFQTSAALEVGGPVTAAANSVLALGAGTHTFHSSFNTSGSLGATGAFIFDGATGSNTMSSLIDPFPATLVMGTGNFSTVGTLAIAGAFTLAQGLLTIGGNCSVSGLATFAGGELNGSGALDVAGAVAMTGTFCTTSPNIFCGGNWTGHVNYAPTNGLVTLDGVVPRQILGATVVFPSLTVANGAVVTTAVPVEVRGATSVVGSLATTSTMRCIGSVNTPTTGVWNLGTGTHRFGGAFSAAGTITATGTFVFDGGTSGGAGGAVSSTLSPLPTVRIESGASTVTLSSGLTIAGALTVMNGNVNITGTPLPVTVLGAAAFSGGVINSATGTLDVDGDVVFNGTIATAIGVVRCGGNWTSGPNFVPTAGTVELDGAGPTAIVPAILGQPVNFFNFTTKNGARTLTGTLNLFGSTALIENGSTLSLPNGARVDSFGVAMTVNGTLAVEGGGEARFDPTSALTIAPIGRLRLVGTTSLSASIDGSSGGGYALTVGGVLEAQYFLVRRMSAAGMVVQNTCQIGSAPLDFRDGTLDFPRNVPGAVLLDVTRSLPTTFSNVSFQNSGGAVGAFNAKAPGTSAQISMQNATGAFSGPGFESDPSARIDWTSGALTTLTAFNVAPGAGSATITWTTLVETGVVVYVLERVQTTGGGSFAPVFIPPASGPTSYLFVDGGLIAGTNYTWRLSEFNGTTTTVLGTATATPTSAAPPANLFTVGSPGLLTTQAAVNAATLANSVVRIPNGAFARFTINAGAPGLLKVAADVGAAVTIATTTGAVTISNVPAGRIVELSGLTIGSAAGVHPAVLVQNCAGLVILDELSLTGGVGQPALRIVNSPNVCVQRVFAIGTPSLSIESASFAYVSSSFAANVTLSGASTMVDCQLSLTGTVTSLGGSVRATFLGVMPDLALPDFGPLSTPVTAGIKSFPNSPWFVGLQSNYELLTLAPLVEMPILINPFLAGFSFAASGVADGLGNSSVQFFLPPNAGLVGATFSFQVLTTDLAGPGTYRMSGGESITIIP